MNFVVICIERAWQESPSTIFHPSHKTKMKKKKNFSPYSFQPALFYRAAGKGWGGGGGEEKSLTYFTHTNRVTQLKIISALSNYFVLFKIAHSTSFFLDVQLLYNQDMYDRLIKYSFFVECSHPLSISLFRRKQTLYMIVLVSLAIKLPEQRVPLSTRSKFVHPFSRKVPTDAPQGHNHTINNRGEDKTRVGQQ